MTDPASPAAVTEERISDDQIQYRTMILRGTGNPITADLIEGLARERAAAEARIAQANEARDRLFFALRMMSIWFDLNDGIENLKPSPLASSRESGERMRRACIENADRLVVEFAPIVDASPTPPAQSAETEKALERIREYDPSYMRAQSAGEALDPAGTGEGAKGDANTQRALEMLPPRFRQQEMRDE